MIDNYSFRIPERQVSHPNGPVPPSNLCPHEQNPLQAHIAPQMHPFLICYYESCIIQPYYSINTTHSITFILWVN